MTPSEYISFIHSILPIIKSGFEIQCYAFHKLMKLYFPEAIAYYNNNHVVSMIDGVLYDIHGVVTDTDIPYLPMIEVYGQHWIDIHESEELLIDFYKGILHKTLENVTTNTERK